MQADRLDRVYLLVKSSLRLFTGEFFASQDSVGDELNVSVCSSDAIVVLHIAFVDSTDNRIREIPNR